jgi:hypothetical protein
MRKVICVQRQQGIHRQAGPGIALELFEDIGDLELNLLNRHKEARSRAKRRTLIYRPKFMNSATPNAQSHMCSEATRNTPPSRFKSFPTIVPKVIRPTSALGGRRDKLMMRESFTACRPLVGLITFGTMVGNDAPPRQLACY